MKNIKKTAAAACMIALSLVMTTGLAHADFRRGPPPRAVHDREWAAHADHAHRYWGHPGPQPVVYAPPVVYSAPPPPDPGINLIVPLHFN